jgi:hypothetical protein
MKRLNEKTAKEASIDLIKLRDPAYGGFNLLYGDGYYANSLEEKWGMSIEELDKKTKEILDPNNFNQCAGAIKLYSDNLLCGIITKEEYIESIKTTLKEMKKILKNTT